MKSKTLLTGRSIVIVLNTSFYGSVFEKNIYMKNAEIKLRTHEIIYNTLS